MYQELFEEFLKGSDTLRVYQGNQLIFSSTKDRLLPLLEYLDRFAPHHQQVVIFDEVMGNAAALLSVEAGCREVYSPLGSKLATDTLEKYGIKYHLGEIVPYIKNSEGTDMCPMERLSLGKAPAEFHQIMRDRLK